jgi:hypothetical protein
MRRGGQRVTRDLWGGRKYGACKAGAGEGILEDVVRSRRMQGTRRGAWIETLLYMYIGKTKSRLNRRVDFYKK